MRTIFLAIAAAAAIAVAGTSGSSAAPINGGVIEQAVSTSQPALQVHCRRYPHRHRHGIPHGWGFGCR